MNLVPLIRLQGLVTLPEPPAQQLPSRPGIPNPDIADIDEESVQSVINPGAMKILQAIALGGRSVPSPKLMSPNRITKSGQDPSARIKGNYSCK